MEFHLTATECHLPYHTVLPATRHKWKHPALTPAIQAGTRFTYPGGDGRLSWPRWLVSCYIPRWFTRPQAVTHPSTNRTQCRLTTLIEANALTTTLHRHLHEHDQASSGLQFKVAYWPAMTLGGAAQVAAAHCLNERTLDPAVCSYTDPPVPQPAALWPSPRNVLRQRLTIFSSECYQILTCRLCCWLVTDLLATKWGNRQLVIDLLRGNWCNGFWPLHHAASM